MPIELIMGHDERGPWIHRRGQPIHHTSVFCVNDLELRTRDEINTFTNKFAQGGEKSTKSIGQQVMQDKIKRMGSSEAHSNRTSPADPARKPPTLDTTAPDRQQELY